LRGRYNFLKKRGVDFKIIEASSRVGGRQFSGTKLFPNNQFVEFGGEFIDSNHQNIKTLALRLGLKLEDLKALSLNNSEEFYFHSEKLSDNFLIEAFFPLAKIINSELVRCKKDPKYLKILDNLSLQEWLAKQNDVDYKLRALINQAYTGEFGLDTSKQSVFNLLWLLKVDAPSSFQIFGDSDERYRIVGGNDNLAKALGGILEKNIFLNESLVSIKDHGLSGYKLSFKRDGYIYDIDADYVVMAIPFSVLKEIDLNVSLSKEKLFAINNLAYGTNAKLYLNFTKRVWQESYNSSAYIISSSDLQSCWETSRLQPGENGILTVFKGGKGGIELGNVNLNNLASNTIEELGCIYPKLSASYVKANTRRFSWADFKFAMGSYACLGPGQVGMIEACQKREGNVIFAGEHCSPNFQGYMEGAVESGMQAAATVLAC
jgi:monoamine oxidase